MIHVLYLDDEPHNLSAFQAAFRRDFRVHTTTEPTDAVALLREHPVEVLISDQKMPNISGVEFFELIMNDYPDPVRMLLTGHADLDWLHATVRQLADRSGLPMPEVGYYESPEVNAFATGPSRSRSLVAVSTGLLRTMSRDEVEGVLAHEVAHIQNGDMVTMTLIQGVVNAFVMFFARIIANILRNTVDERASGAVYFLSYMVLQVVLGILGMVVVAWFSRAREFRADAGAATLAGYFVLAVGAVLLMSM